LQNTQKALLQRILPTVLLPGSYQKETTNKGHSWKARPVSYFRFLSLLLPHFSRFSSDSSLQEQQSPCSSKSVIAGDELFSWLNNSENGSDVEEGTDESIQDITDNYTADIIKDDMEDTESQNPNEEDIVTLDDDDD
jgi:hypothetical protein